MQQVGLGRSELRVSRIGYGCWRLAGSEGAEAPPDVMTSGKRAVHAAVEAGFTFFDLADIYGGGRCEEIFGAALREVPGLRDRIVVASKCGIRKADTPAPGAPYRYDSSAVHIVNSVEASLRRIGTGTLDLLMLHRPDFLMDTSEVAGAFVQLRDAGKVREFGVSNFLPGQLTALQKACPLPIIVNQVEISLARMSALDDGTLDQCLDGAITPLAWSPLARGALVRDEPVELDRPDHAARAALAQALDDVARNRGVTRATVALAWLMTHPSRIVPIIGTVDPARIRDSADGSALTLDRDEWYRLLTAARGTRLS